MACKQTHKKNLLVRQEGKRCISATYVNLVSKLSTVLGTTDLFVRKNAHTSYAPLRSNGAEPLGEGNL